MKLEAIDAILATNPRYAGASDRPIPPNLPWANLESDAKLNAPNAIVAERLVDALQGNEGG